MEEALLVLRAGAIAVKDMGEYYSKLVCYGKSGSVVT